MRRHRIILKLVALLALALTSAGTYAGTIILAGDTNITTYINHPELGPESDNPTFFNNVLGDGTEVSFVRPPTPHWSAHGISLSVFYGDIEGVSVTHNTGDITTESLLGVDLLFSGTPYNAYNAAEVSALSFFLDQGGTFFLYGDAGSSNSVRGYINDLLADLGSSMTIDCCAENPSSNIASGAQIVNDPLTQGVSRFYYNFAMPLAVNNGTGLVYNSENRAIVAYESIGIPVPATLALFGLALACLSVLRARKGR
jgi:hypothetical protein